MLDLHRLRLLRELKHRGTLAAVAEALAYTPSAISQQLSVLETEAGVQLLERAGRRVRLTPAAGRLVEHTEAILERLERARADLDASAASIGGTVRVAAFHTTAHAVIPAALPALAAVRQALATAIRPLAEDRLDPGQCGYQAPGLSCRIRTTDRARRPARRVWAAPDGAGMACDTRVHGGARHWEINVEEMAYAEHPVPPGGPFPPHRPNPPR